MITLRDPETGRTAELSPPDPARMRLDLVSLTDLARRWCNVLTHDEAEAELGRLLADDASSVLHGLAWVLSAWAVLAAARTGVRADDAIRSLDYQGPWRQTSTPDERQTWETLTGIVRQGALAQLARSDEVTAAFERNAAQQPELPAVLAHHTLVLIDGLQQDMQRHGLPTWVVAQWVTAPGDDA